MVCVCGWCRFELLELAIVVALPGCVILGGFGLVFVVEGLDGFGA